MQLEVLIIFAQVVQDFVDCLLVFADIRQDGLAVVFGNIFRFAEFVLTNRVRARIFRNVV